MSMKIKTQVLVLGAGPGGYSAAFRCSDLGLQTTIVERYSNLGGVCLNVGCIPSKTLLHISKLIKISKNLNKFGIFTTPINTDIKTIRSWKNNIISQLSNKLHIMAKTRNVKIINGFGKFIDNNTLKILHNDQKYLEIIFEYAIIATGSRPISLPFAPNDKRIWDSTNALSLQSIPKNLLIIGGGAIGLEISTIYNALGSEVDLIETHNQIIPNLDKNIIQSFTKILNKDINLITNTKINKIHTTQHEISAHIVQNDTTKSIIKKYNAILIAIGRSPNVDTLNLKNTDISLNKNGFISVDQQMRTNVPHIFAIGDVIGHPMLAHKSIYEGRIVAEVISGNKFYFDTKIIPSVIYTNPEIAWVGCTEKEAQSNNINYETTIFPWTASGKAIASDCTEGMTKLIFDKKTHKIIGGEILGEHASEILGEIALAIEMGCDVEDITLTIHAHPTLYESIASASSIYNGSVTDLPNLNIKNNFH